MKASQLPKSMIKLVQERSRIHGIVVKRALAEIASDMNELTNERSRIHASIVKRALGS